MIQCLYVRCLSIIHNNRNNDNDNSNDSNDNNDNNDVYDVNGNSDNDMILMIIMIPLLQHKASRCSLPCNAVFNISPILLSLLLLLLLLSIGMYNGNSCILLISTNS